MRRVVGAGVFVALSSTAPVAWSNDEPPPVHWISNEDGAPPSSPPPIAAPEPPPDGPRFRLASGLTGGLVIDDAGRTRVAGGTISRFGVQFDDVWAAYTQPEVGFLEEPEFADANLLGWSALLDVTLFDRVFVAAGVGFVLVADGPQVVLRLGGYPFVVRNDDWPVREGLSVGTTVRLQFVDGRSFVVPTLDVGVEFF